MNIRCNCRRKLATVTTVGRLPHVQAHDAQAHIDSLTMHSTSEAVTGEPFDLDDWHGLPSHSALTRYFARGPAPVTEKAILFVCHCRIRTTRNDELRNTLRMAPMIELIRELRRDKSSVNIEDFTRLDPYPWLHGQLFGADVDDFKTLRPYSAERDADRAAEIRTLFTSKLTDDEKAQRAAHHAGLKGLENRALANWYQRRLPNEHTID